MGNDALVYLKTTKFRNDIYNFCAQYYFKFIGSDAENAKENFILMMKWDGNSDESQDIVSCFSNDEYEKELSEVNGMVRKIVENISADNPDEDTFYSILWREYNGNVLFNSTFEKICALISLVISPGIPYFQLKDSLKIEDNKYISISNSIRMNILEIDSVMERDHHRKTDAASHIYRIMNELGSEEEKIVFLSHVIDYYKNALEDMLCYENDNDLTE